MIDDDVGLLLKMVQRNRMLFKNQYNADLEKQKLRKPEAARRMSDDSRAKLMEKVRESVSVFYLPRILSKDELEKELKRHGTMVAPRKRIL